MNRPRSGRAVGWLLIHLVLLVVALVTLTPMVWLIAATFKSPRYIFSYTFFGPAYEEPAGRNVVAWEFWETFDDVYTGPGTANDALAAALDEVGVTPPPGFAADWNVEEFPDDFTAEDLRETAALIHGQTGLADDERDLFGRIFFETFAQRFQDNYTGIPHEEPRAVLPTLSLQNFANLNASIPFPRYVINSFFVTCVTVLIQLFLASLGGFALAKYSFRFKQPIMILMLLTMMIPGHVMLAPLYELIYHMGFVDTYTGLIIPGAVNVFGMFLFRQSMLQIPNDLVEAGRVDGCTEFRIYWSIALPVSRPMIGAFTLISFMMAWNNFLWPQIILQTQERFTLPIGLNQMVSVYAGNYGALMAGTFLSVLPVVVLFFLLQREFISGLTAGAVKG